MSLQSREEMISLHNTQSHSAAVALITKSIQRGAPAGSRSPDQAHVVPYVCRGEDECTCLQTKYPPVPPVSLLTFPSPPPAALSLCLSLPLSFYLPLNPITVSAARRRISSVCTGMAGEDGGLGQKTHL